MKNIDQILQETLAKKLASEGYELDLVAVPGTGDRMIRARTLEEALHEFEGDGSNDSRGYLVQVRARRQNQLDTGTAPEPFPEGSEEAIFSRLAEETLDPSSRKARTDEAGVYDQTGRLNIPFLCRNGELLFHAGDFALAKNIYRTLLQSGERTGLAHFWLARCLEAEGDFEPACRHYGEAITFEPSLEAYQRQAALLIRSKKDAEAAEVMERALRIAVQNNVRFELHKAAGNCWLRASKPEAARDHYEQALKIEPTSDAVLANLGALHLKAGRTAEARQKFDAALAINAKNEKALSGLGSCAYEEGNKRQAHDYFAAALALRLNNANAVYYLVKCAFEIRSYATAARILGDYIDIAPVNPNLLYSLAGLHYHLGRFEQARKTAERTLTLRPDHTGAKELLDLMSGNATKA